MILVIRGEDFRLAFDQASGRDHLAGIRRGKRAAGGRAAAEPLARAHRQRRGHIAPNRWLQTWVRSGLDRLRHLVRAGLGWSRSCRARGARVALR